MRITLEYDAEEKADAECALKATDYGLVLWDMSEWLNDGANAGYSKEETAVYERCGAKLDEVMAFHAVEFPE